MSQNVPECPTFSTYFSNNLIKYVTCGAVHFHPGQPDVRRAFRVFRSVAHHSRSYSIRNPRVAAELARGISGTANPRASSTATRIRLEVPRQTTTPAPATLLSSDDERHSRSPPRAVRDPE